MSTQRGKNTGSKKVYINEMGSVLKGDKGNYIKIEKDVTLPKGSKLYITPIEEHIQGLVERGVISQEKANARLENMPDFVLSSITAVIDG